MLEGRPSPGGVQYSTSRATGIPKARNGTWWRRDTCTRHTEKYSRECMSYHFFFHRKFNARRMSRSFFLVKPACASQWPSGLLGRSPIVKKEHWTCLHTKPNKTLMWKWTALSHNISKEKFAQECSVGTTRNIPFLMLVSSGRFCHTTLHDIARYVPCNLFDSVGTEDRWSIHFLQLCGRQTIPHFVDKGYYLFMYTRIQLRLVS